jgi:hypothetical protein
MTLPLDPDALSAHYESMWTEAAPTLQAGRAALDPQLARLADDARRGVTYPLTASQDAHVRSSAR